MCRLWANTKVSQMHISSEKSLTNYATHVLIVPHPSQLFLQSCRRTWKALMTIHNHNRRRREPRLAKCRFHVLTCGFTVGRMILVPGKSVTEHKQRETELPVRPSAASSHHAALRLNQRPQLYDPPPSIRTAS